MPNKMWDEITYPLPNLNGGCNRWNLGMDKLFHPTHYWVCDYLSMLINTFLLDICHHSLSCGDTCKYECGLSEHHLTNLKRYACISVSLNAYELVKSQIRGLTGRQTNVPPPPKFGIHLHWLHMSVMVSQIIGNSTVCSTACSGWQQRSHKSSALLAGPFPLPMANECRKCF